MRNWYKFEMLILRFPQIDTFPENFKQIFMFFPVPSYYKKVDRNVADYSQLASIRN